MTAPVSLVLALLGLFVLARIRLTAVIFGRLLSVSLLDLAVVVLVLVLAAMVLWLARLLIRDGLQLRPRVVSP